MCIFNKKLPREQITVAPPAPLPLKPSPINAVDYKIGDIGPGVREVQTFLNLAFDNTLLVDGHFGPKTEYYVKQFQKRVSLAVTGVVDSVTFAALKTSKPVITIPLTRIDTTGDYPKFAHILPQKMPERGLYLKGSPIGAIFHFTAGHDGAENTIIGGIKNKYTFWCIQRDGSLYCAHRYQYWGYHAGESKWKNILGGVSDDLIGIEVNAYGRVKPIAGKPGKYLTWFGKEIDQIEVRYTPGRDNQMEGYYHVYTDSQVETFIQTMMWLKAKNPTVFDFDNVLGHDEVSGKSGLGYWRKNDPGAALDMTMPKFRELLKQRWTEINK